MDTATPETESHETEHGKGSWGSVLAILLIVFLLVVGAFYVWGQRISEQRAQEQAAAAANALDALRAQEGSF